MSRPSILRRLLNPARRPDPKPARPSRLAVESLEDRAVPATIFVTGSVTDAIAYTDPARFDDGPVSSLTHLGDGDTYLAANLRSAVFHHNDFVGASTIVLDAGGTYALTSTSGGELDITYTGGSTALTIEGDGLATIARQGDGSFRLIEVNGGGATTLDHLRLTGGAATSGPGRTGGAVRNNAGGSLTVSACTLDGNSADHGGGISNEGGTLTLTGSTVSGNRAVIGDGGGIYNRGTLTVTDSTVTGNATTGFFGGHGGGIYSDNTLTVSSSTVSGNASSFGGGIDNRGTLTVTGSTVSGNGASTEGGGIRVNGGTVALTGTTISDNNGSFGGGIRCNGGEVVVTNCTFSGNAAQLGGGLYNAGGTLTVTNATLSGNTAGTGGGIAFYYGSLTLDNSIAANNTGGDVFVSNSATLAGSHNLIEDGSGGLADTTTGDPQLGDLADNGGPMATFALLPGSPAIDAGDNALVLGVTTDQRGLARVSGGVVDIGAFEAQQNRSPTLAAPATLVAFEDAARVVPGVTVGDPDGDALTVTLAAGHGTLAVGTTDGLTVTGNGTGVVTLSGSAAGLNAALATLTYRGALNFAGNDWLSVTAGDGRLSTTSTTAVHVKSAAEQAADLRALVAAMRADGDLTGGQATALTAKLSLQGNAGDAGKVQAFLNQVQALFNAGILTQAEADALAGPGRVLLLSLSQR